MNYEQLLTAIDAANQTLLGRAAQAVNQALVLRNWLIDARLVEFEQSGEDRARYGEQLLSNVRGRRPQVLADNVRYKPKPHHQPGRSRWLNSGLVLYDSRADGAAARKHAS